MIGTLAGGCRSERNQKGKLMAVQLVDKQMTLIGKTDREKQVVLLHPLGNDS